MIITFLVIEVHQGFIMHVRFRKASEIEWLEHVNADETATFFQTPLWFAVWEKYQRYENESVFFEFTNGKCGVFPMASRPILNGLFKEFIASPAGTYGGAVSAYELEEYERTLLEHNIFKNRNYIYRTNPFTTSGFNRGHIKSDFTHLINLREIDINDVLRNWRKGHKADAKRALREGVQIEEARNSNDLHQYYSAYLESIHRWGDKASSLYQLQIFEYLMKLPSDSVKLWKAVFDEKLIYGCLCFYHNNHVVYWHGAGLSEYFKLGAVHALQMKIIEDAIKRNFKFYDFNPSGGHIGVEKFKDGFGTLTRPTVVIKGTTVPRRIAKKVIGFFS
jgi:hypothetical protein